MSAAASPVAVRDGEIITFYSYKGGVGRSMALANLATMLAHEGKKVLAVDCDFEAPGLHRYFPRRAKESSRRGEPEAGTIDFFAAMREVVTREQAGTADLGQRALRSAAALAALLDEPDRFGYQAAIANPNGEANGSVRIWPAGRFDANYPETVRSFEWQTFYREHPYVFPTLAAEWSRRFDYILVDSRTGVTDVGGICTVLLPEKLVLVFTPNNQSLVGALEIGLQAVQQREKSEDLRPLVLLPLISRVENAETLLREQWIKNAREKFEACFRRAYDFETCDLTSYFHQVRIPHSSFYAYDEVIAAEREAAAQQGSLAAAFSTFLRFLRAGSPMEALAERASESATSTAPSLAATKRKFAWVGPVIAMAVTVSVIFGSAWRSANNDKEARARAQQEELQRVSRELQKARRDVVDLDSASKRIADSVAGLNTLLPETFGTTAPKAVAKARDQIDQAREKHAAVNAELAQLAAFRTLVAQKATNDDPVVKLLDENADLQAQAGAARQRIDEGRAALAATETRIANAKDNEPTSKTDDARKIWLEGLSASRKGNKNAARQKFEEAVKIDPSFPPPYVGLGNLASTPESAIRYYREALAQDLGSAPAWNNLGLELAWKGQKDEGLRLINEAIHRDPYRKLYLDNLKIVKEQSAKPGSLDDADRSASR